MSTDAAPRFLAGRGLTLALSLAALAACATRTAARLESLCESPPPAVVLPLTLAIDSVIPSAPLQLRQNRGERFDLTLTLHPGDNPLPPDCPDRSGVVTYDDGLPVALAEASAGSGNAAWRFEGGRIVVDFAPRFRDNNLRLSLPLTGSEGEWSLSTIVGNVASGRVLRD